MLSLPAYPFNSSTRVWKMLNHFQKHRIPRKTNFCFGNKEKNQSKRTWWTNKTNDIWTQPLPYSTSSSFITPSCSPAFVLYTERITRVCVFVQPCTRRRDKIVTPVILLLHQLRRAKELTNIHTRSVGISGLITAYL